MKYLKVATIAALLLAIIWVAPVEAQGVWGACTGNSDSAVCAQDDMSDFILNIVNTLLYFVGALSVIFIIWAGFKYVTSSGNPENVKSAKSTLTYAVIGLIVASLAYAIANTVVSTVKGGEETEEVPSSQTVTPNNSGSQNSGGVIHQ